MKGFLNILFGLPPAAQRPPMLESWVGKYCINRADEKKDDLYVYYLAYKRTFDVHVFFSLVFVFIYLTGVEIDLGFYKILAPETKRVEALLEQYSTLMTVLLLTTVYPFYLVKFLWNVNPKRYDVLHFNDAFKDLGTRKRMSFIPRMLFVFSMCVVVMLFGHVATKALPLSMFYSETLFSLIFYLMFGAIIYVVAMIGILTSTINLIRYIGLYEGD